MIEKETNLGFDITENRTHEIADLYDSSIKNQESDKTEVLKPILKKSKKIISHNTEPEFYRHTDTTGSGIGSENKNLLKGIAAVGVILAVILFIFYLVGGALNGIAVAVGSIPKWLLIPLFVGAILFFNGAFNRTEDK